MSSPVRRDPGEKIGYNCRRSFWQKRCRRSPHPVQGTQGLSASVTVPFFLQEQNSGLRSFLQHTVGSYLLGVLTYWFGEEGKITSNPMAGLP